MKKTIFSFSILTLTLLALGGCSNLTLPDSLATIKNQKTVSALAPTPKKNAQQEGAEVPAPKAIAGPTQRIMLSPINTRVVYESYAQTNVLGAPKTIYYEYFMEPPINLSYNNENIPAAYMIRRVNDGENKNEVRLLLAITKGGCLFTGGTITELDPVNYTPKTPALDWVLNNAKPIGGALYESSIPTQNVLGTELCLSYSPEFLEYKAQQDKLNQKR